MKFKTKNQHNSKFKNQKLNNIKEKDFRQNPRIQRINFYKKMDFLEINFLNICTKINSTNNDPFILHI